MFVTFEGPDGAGKTTALAAVAEVFRSEGLEVLATREPGAGEVGAQIRHIVLHAASLDSHAEVFLFLADRANHVASIIRPALAAKKLVLCDRFVDSTIVYQGHARGLEIDVLRSLNLFATSGLRPDLTLLFDLDTEVGLSRLTTLDRLDAETPTFHRRVRAGFLTEMNRDPLRWRLIDASQPAALVAQIAVEAIRQTMA